MCKAFLQLINIIIGIFCIVYLANIYSDTYIDTPSLPFKPGEKELFFMNPSENTNFYARNHPICQYYQEKIMNPSVQKLEDVFNFRVQGVHTRSKILLVIIIIIFSFYLFIFIYAFFIACFPSSAGICSILFLIGIIIVFVASFIDIIVFISILFTYYGGDTTTYYDFLSCSNVNYNGFSRYRNLEYLKVHFKYYVIYQIINMILNFFVGKGKEN